MECAAVCAPRCRISGASLHNLSELINPFAMGSRNLSIKASSSHRRYALAKPERGLATAFRPFDGCSGGCYLLGIN
jgi:hypothetical protein